MPTYFFKYCPTYHYDPCDVPLVVLVPQFEKLGSKVSHSSTEKHRITLLQLGHVFQNSINTNGGFDCSEKKIHFHELGGDLRRVHRTFPLEADTNTVIFLFSFATPTEKHHSF